MRGERVESVGGAGLLFGVRFVGLFLFLFLFGFLFLFDGFWGVRVGGFLFGLDLYLFEIYVFDRWVLGHLRR